MSRRRISARAVLFDWDGTLLDSYQSDTRAYLEMFGALGISWGVEELAEHYSPNWHRVYRAARIPRVQWQEADLLWERAYQKESPPLLPGARRVLRALEREFDLALVTSGNRRRVRRQLRAFGLSRKFGACVCCEDAPRRKPHPAPLQLAISRLRAEPEECVYIGDTPDDIEMARRAGVRAIAVLGPFPTHQRLRAAKPDMLLETIAELPERLAPDGDN